MVSRDRDDKPYVDHMQIVQKRLTGYAGVKSVEIGTSDRVAAATAKLRACEGVVTIDHAGRRLTISATSCDLTDKIAEKAKDIWRNHRGPKLKHLRPQGVQQAAQH